jgi:hypothetical protein
MGEFFSNNGAMMGWLGAISVVTFIVSVLSVPIVVARLPADYFLKERPATEACQDRHPIIRWAFLGAKNLLGILLVLGGFAMLVLPGQGILTMLIGVMLLDFPGKRRLEAWILERSAVEKLVNWIRRKRGREPLRFPKSRKQQKRAASTGPSLKA